MFMPKISRRHFSVEITLFFENAAATVIKYGVDIWNYFAATAKAVKLMLIFLPYNISI